MLTLLFLLISAIVFSQEKKVVPSGYITFISNSTFDFKNLTIDGQNVSYFNDVTKAQMKFPLSSVKKIVNNYGTTIYEMPGSKVVKKEFEEENTVKNVPLKKTEEEKLVYRSSNKIMLNDKRTDKESLKLLLKTDPDVYNTYKRGNNNATLGAILISGGIGLFVGGGISNLTNANNGSSGSPALLIAGIVVSGIGIPVRIGGVNKIKEALDYYNEMPSKKVSALERSEFKITAGANGIGLLWQL